MNRFQNRLMRTALAVMLPALCAMTSLADEPLTLHVDGNVSASGDGSSWETAYKTLEEAHVPSGHDTHALILIRGDQHYAVGMFNLSRSGESPERRKIFRGVPGTNGLGRLPILSGATVYDESAFSPTNGYDKVFWIEQASTVFAVWQGPSDGELEDVWLRYSEQDSLADVQATPASWYRADNKLFVHTSTGQHPEHFLVRPTAANFAISVRASYVAFENLEMRHSRNSALELVAPDSSYVSVSNCVFHHTGRYGGVLVRGASHVDIRDNLFYAMPPGDRAVMSQAWPTSDPDRGEHVRVIGNTFDLTGSGAQGISIVADHSEIRENILLGAHRGMFVVDCDHVRIVNNLVANTDDRYAIWLRDSANGEIVHNTLVNGRLWDLYLANVSTNARVFNNLVWVSGAGNGGLRVDADAATGLLSDYNNWYATDGATMAQLNGTDHATLADWQAASGQDAHSISADPRFVDASAGNYRLDRASPCRDAGTAVFDGIAAPDRDLDGNRRPMNNGFDLGAYEYPVGGTILLIR